jgi:hypothetical protein
MQLLENLTNTVANMQAQANNPPQPPATAASAHE